MHRSPRVLFTWTIVVVVAIVTARLVATDLAALHRRARTLGPDTRVVLAARDLPLGATIRANDVHVVVRPLATVPPDAMRDPQDAAGRVVAHDLAREDVVRAVHLAPRERTGLDGIVPVGRRAVHIRVGDGFRPAVGAVVDVLAAFDPALGADGPRNEASAVAVGARVLAVDDPAASGPEGGPGVTLLVTSGEAAAVAYAASNGSVSIALAPPETACCTSSTSLPGP